VLERRAQETDRTVQRHHRQRPPCATLVVKFDQCPCTDRARYRRPARRCKGAPAPRKNPANVTPKDGPRARQRQQKP
jgi:hypothetical protein